jgi:hypothetical protein
VGLSGDDPSTSDTDERWDVFYGGWPQFGDLLAWSWVNLGSANLVAGHDPGYASGSSTFGEVVYSNLTIATVGLDLTPHPDWSLRLSGARLGAQEAAGGSSDLGNYAQVDLRHQATSNLSFGVYGAVIDPGDRFPDGSDIAHELFWETNVDF